MRLSQTKTDAALEHDGAWVRIRYGVQVLVARMGNARAEAWRARLSTEDRRMLDNTREYTRRPELYPAQLAKVAELMRSNIAETVLLDWREIEDDAGEEVPFSVDTAKTLLAEYDWFYQDVLEAANSRETFFRTEVQEQGNGSPKSSGGRGGTRKS